jgi:hypothetical protein
VIKKTEYSQPKESEYTERVLDMLLSDREKAKAEWNALREIRKQRYGIDPTAQPASTAALLSMTDDEAAIHRNRPIVSKSQAQIVDRDGNVDVGQRQVDIKDIVLIEGMRRASKNTQGDSISEGASSVTVESNIRAIEAFQYEQAAQITAAQAAKAVELGLIVKATPIDTPPEPPKPSLSTKILHWLWKRGVRVDRLTKSEFSVDIADKDE